VERKRNKTYLHTHYQQACTDNSTMHRDPQPSTFLLESIQVSHDHVQIATDVIILCNHRRHADLSGIVGFYCFSAEADCRRPTGVELFGFL
jgi:hypothetical protein